MVHNAYQQYGGEDRVVECEIALLRSAGHDVREVIVSNSSIRSLEDKARVFFKSAFDKNRSEWMGELVRAYEADIVHVHNFFPLLTPAVHAGAKAAGAAVVQTLHNYRLLCANALFLRGGNICEKCLQGSNVWSVVHRCYRDSVASSLAVARMQTRARVSGSWDNDVHRFIALTEFARQKFIAGGIRADRIVVKPNFAKASVTSIAARAGALYVGRLSSEKGVQLLVDAWRGLPNLALTVVGDGPDRERLEALAPPNVRFIGQVSTERVRVLMSQAAMLLVPSVWYEGFPMTIVEAYAAGLPVFASRIGSLAEVVLDHETGRLFEPGSSDSIRATVLSVTADELALMGRAAEAVFDSKYSEGPNLLALEQAYDAALSARG